MKKVKKVGIMIVAALIIFLAAWIIWGNITVGVTHETVVSSELPRAFDHYKIVVVSDLHNAEFGESNSRLVELIKAEQPDCIAITGDLVDSSKTNIEVAVTLAENLAAIAPCYYVTGNHEAWLGEQYQELEKDLIEQGITVLHDESMRLERDGGTIQLIGLDDPDFTDRDAAIQQSMLETKLNNLDLTEDYCVLLSHRPELFDAYRSADVDLVLSGHAHGGQFRLPFVGGVVAPNQGLFPQYDAGIYTEGNTTMVVSRGLGNSIIPIRFNNRPEIVCVELVCKE